jgi:hypothetical protein
MPSMPGRCPRSRRTSLDPLSSSDQPGRRLSSPDQAAGPGREASRPVALFEAIEHPFDCLQPSGGPFPTPLITQCVALGDPRLHDMLPPNERRQAGPSQPSTAPAVPGKGRLASPWHRPDRPDQDSSASSWRSSTAATTAVNRSSDQESQTTRLTTAGRLKELLARHSRGDE